MEEDSAKLNRIKFVEYFIFVNLNDKFKSISTCATCKEEFPITNVQSTS